MTGGRAGLIALAITIAGCGPADGPVAIAVGQDACASCRMVFTGTTTAAEIVAPGELPLLFDDFGCLRDYLQAHPLDAGAAVYVREHRRQAWIDGRGAAYSTLAAAATPMGSGLLAHDDAASRQADPAARGATPVDVAQVLGGAPGDRP